MASFSAQAAEKKLTTVLESPSIEKWCGKFFAVTTFGDRKPDAPVFLFYRLAGGEKNEVTMANRTTVEIKNISEPVVEETPERQLVFRMAVERQKEVEACIARRK